MFDHALTPVTRRELRLAERRARRAPADRLRAMVTPRRGRHARSRSHEAFLAPVAQVAVCALLVAGGVGHAQALRADHAEQVSQAAAAIAAHDELVRQERVAHASSSRLTAGAAAYAAHQLDEALAVAQAAVDDAGAVVATAVTVVSPEQLSPLDAALTELTAIIESSPRPAEVAAPEPVRDGEVPPGTTPVVAPVTPPGASTPAVSPSASPNASPDTGRATGPGKEATGPSQPTAPATPPTAPTAPPVTAPPVTALTTGPSAGSSAGSSAAPAQAGRTGPEVDEIPAPGVSTTVGPPTTRPLETTADLSTLGLEVSARLIAAAQALTVLTSEIQAVADAHIAAAQAEAAAAAAAQAASDRLAEQVATADRSPNGAIPLDSLCGVGFAADVLLRCDAAIALEQLNTAYQARFGTSLVVLSTYRDLAGQAAARELRGTLAAVPGTSNHGRGLAVDLGRTGTVGQFDTPAYLWLKAHAGEHGWFHPVYMEPGGNGPFEPWHWEFDPTWGR